MDINNFFSGIYCINLKSRPDRWQLAQREFEKLNMDVERFSAIIDEYPPRGCLKSHIALLEQHQKNGGGNILIFEDDVEFIDEPKDIVEKSLEEINNLKRRDMLYLGGNILKPFYQKTDHLAFLTHCQSTHAYSINGESIDTVLEALKNEDYFIDVLYSTKIIPWSICYITIPMVAIQRSDYSDIEKRKMTYDIPIQRYNQNLIRMPEDK